MPALSPTHVQMNLFHFQLFMFFSSAAPANQTTDLLRQLDLCGILVLNFKWTNQFSPWGPAAAAAASASQTLPIELVHIVDTTVELPSGNYFFQMAEKLDQSLGFTGYICSAYFSLSFPSSSNAFNSLRFVTKDKKVCNEASAGPNECICRRSNGRVRVRRLWWNATLTIMSYYRIFQIPPVTKIACIAFVPWGKNWFCFFFSLKFFVFCRVRLYHCELDHVEFALFVTVFFFCSPLPWLTDYDARNKWENTIRKSSLPFVGLLLRIQCSFILGKLWLNYEQWTSYHMQAIHISLFNAFKCDDYGHQSSSYWA